MRKYRYIILNQSEDLTKELKAQLDGLQHLLYSGSADSLSSAIDLVIEQLPDLIFLCADPEFRKDGLGLNLVAELQRYLRVTPKIVLISADSEAAAEALRYEIFDFIPFPYRRVDLVKAVLKFERSIDAQGFNFSIAPATEPKIEVVEAEHVSEAISDEVPDVNQLEVRDAIPVEKEKPLVICVKSYGDYRFINADDIAYLKADNNSTDIHLNNGEMITAFKTLKHFENVLKSPFVRIHNSYIVNIDYVSRIHTGNSVCYLKNSGIKLPFSKSYKENIDSILQNITKGNYLEI